MSANFKVGDTVRLNPDTTEYAGISPGDLAKVSRVSLFDDAFYVNGSKAACSPDFWTLVSSSATNTESELERLVRVANEGRAALLAIIKDHVGLVHYESPHLARSGSDPVSTGNSFWLYDLALKPPKPAFEPFYVGPVTFSNGPTAERGQWLVKLEGDTLHIGCKTFNARAAKEHLVCFIRHDESDRTMSRSDQTMAYATKSGIKLQSQEILSWADADRILAALEKAGV